MKLVRESTGQLAFLDAVSPLGAGGEARVFLVVADESLVAKVYRKPTEHHARKLSVMIANPPADPMAAQGHVSIAWPVDRLRESAGNERVVGFLMPRVTGTRPVIDYYSPATRRRACPLFNYLYLIRTARNLAAAVHAVHSRGYVIGDVNESNILVTDTSLVTLVDTDSFQVRDSESGETFRCPVGKPEFTPPELQREVFRHVDRTPEHDRFGLAVLIFQLLMEGTHPFAGLYLGEGEPPSYGQRIQDGHFAYRAQSRVIEAMPVAPPFGLLHPAIQDLFMQCFESGHSNPEARPNAEAWINALQEAENELKTCQANEQHRYRKDMDQCPWCARRRRFGRDPFPSKDVVRRGEHLGAAEPTQQRLPPATVSTQPAPIPAPAAQPITAVGIQPDASLNLHAAVPVPPPRPAIITSRRAAPPTKPKSRLWLIAGAAVVVLALLSMLGMAFAQRQRVSRELSAAQQGLGPVQLAWSKIRDSTTAEEARLRNTELNDSADAAIGHAQAVLRLEPGNRDAASLVRQLEGYKRGGIATNETIQAQELLNEVVSSIEKYKNETLSESQARAVRQELKSKCLAALDHCQRALDNDPRSSAAWLQRVRAYRLEGDSAAAINTVKQALALFPDDSALQQQDSLLRGGQ